MDLLLQSASDTRKAHSANREIAAQAREADQQEEVDKLHDEADNTLATGVTTGLMEVGSAGLQGGAASEQNDADMMRLTGGDKANPDGWKAAVDSASSYKISGEVNNAAVGLNKASGDATNKDLEADGKTAAGKASSAKDAYDNENDVIHGERDLKDAILKAYDALLGQKAHLTTAFLAPAQR